MRFVLALAAGACATFVHAALPADVARAFKEAGVPLANVAVVVREAGAPRPLFAHDADRPMNPASVMRLVTPYTALRLARSRLPVKTAYLGGKLDKSGTLAGDLILKGHGDPKITIEQWQAFMADLRAPANRVTGDLVLDPRSSSCGARSRRFRPEPLRPYNVGPDALLVNFKPCVCVRARAVPMQWPCGSSRGCRGRRSRDAAIGRRRPAAIGAKHRAATPISARRSGGLSGSLCGPAVSATGMWRCSIIRITCTACSPLTSVKLAGASMVASGGRPSRNAPP